MTELSIPRHVGYIVDGNRRWAKKHGLPSYEGHLAGYNTVQEIVQATFEAGVEYVSTYIFSTENWKRSQDEVNRIMKMALRFLKSDIDIFVKNDIKLLVVGSRDELSSQVVEAIDSAESITSNCKSGTLVVCFNYGGQLEIVDSIKKIMKSGIKADDVDITTVSSNIYAPEVPPVDIIVRTSGEQRISNFMLWRAAYSEMLFFDKFWPDMDKGDVKHVIDEFSRRARRFGG